MTLREKAKKAFDQMKPHVQEEHKAAWGRCEALVLSRVKKGALSYEVNHSVEYARNLYFAEMGNGFPADLCERVVINAYKV